MPGTTIGYVVATEADLDAAIAAINLSSASAPGNSYVISVTTDLSLTSAIPAINLSAGDTLTIQGGNTDNPNLSAVIDGGGSRGFIVNGGTAIISDLTLTAMSAPGGTGGAIYVAPGASVAANSVTFNGDSAALGGAVYVAQGGTFSASGGSIAGSASGIFIQGNGSITLTNETVTSGIAGSGSVVSDGAVTLSAPSQFTGGTLVNGTLSLLAPNAAGTGAIMLGAPTGDALVIGAGDAPASPIDGFVPNQGAGSIASNVIDLQGIGLATNYKLSPGNVISVVGSQGTATLHLDPTQNYGSDSFVLQPDAGTGTAAGTAVTVVQSAYLVGSEADLNAALALIDISGKFAAPNVAYTITLTAGFNLTSDLDAINLAAGSSLTIDGAGLTIDGGNTYRGFFDYAGGLNLKNMTIQNAVASGGAGGSGAAGGGGGAGLGGGLFVASSGAATLSNVSFINDQAIGGAGGALGSGVGGGGGLGGSGGAGGARDGGGGGIGRSATGGVGGGGSGGAGILLGAGGGIGGTGNRPAGGSGGAFGGGGGGAGTTVTTGSGRGGGGSRTIPGIAGNGGVGGSFGGGGASGKAAGFGGGGANSAGGWGGGGSGLNVGGFGGGAGGGAAGGGVGAGGGVFVQQGGSLTILAGSLSGGNVLGGAGANGGSNGSAFGAGIFIQGSNDLTFAPAAGQTLTIANAIADESGSGGSGTGKLIVNGAGTVDLSATNTFTGGTLLKAGTLSLQAPGAAGTGALTFAYGTADTLAIGAGDVPSNIVSGFLPLDVIDLQGIGTATSAILGAGDVLTISGGTKTVQLSLDPAQNFTGESFHVATDNSGGTLVTASDVANDFPPAVSGTGTVSGNDHTPFDPLAGVTVSTVVPGQIEAVTLTLSSTLNGSLSNLAGGSYDAATGSYTVSGSAATVTAALDGLVFTPTIYQVAPGQVVTTKFGVSVTDGKMTSAAASTTVNVTALNDPPVISGLPPSFVESYWNVPFNPFPTAAVTDPDVGATETVTLTVSSNNTLSLSTPGLTLTNNGGGTYTLSAGTPAEVTAALDALQLTTVPNPSVAGYTINYVGISVSDGIAPAVTSQVEVLSGLPIFTGVMPSQSVLDGKTISPFSTVAVTDSASLSIQSMTITLYDSSSNYLNPTDANGTLSGPNLTHVSAGIYTLTPGSTTTVSAELDALVFTPSPSGGTAFTTDFVLSAFDGATTADSSAIAVTTLCFCAGTRIATPSGETPVERIAAGDLVLTSTGESRPVAWVGVGRVLATRGRRTAATPVIVRKGALADNVPHHDLRVTKGHAVYLDDVLIPIEFLVNHRSILWDDRAQEVELYHLELDSHDVLLANGAPAESYRDDGNRWLFGNANSGWDLPPQEPCAPVVTGGPIVDAVWQRLLDRAGGPGRMPTTDEPDLHLVADGRRIEGRRDDAGTYRFRLPQAATNVRVISRAGVPCEVGLARDPRLLGVAVKRIMCWQGARLRLIEASDPALCDGFHMFEEANGFRWTDGDARLPETLFDGATGVVDLELHVGATARYPLFAEEQVDVAA